MAHCEMYPKQKETAESVASVGFPVVFTKTGKDGYVIHIPDLGIDTQGKDFEDGIIMAGDAIGLMCVDLQDDKKEIPKPTSLEDTKLKVGEFATVVYVDLSIYRAQLQNSHKPYDDDEDMMSPEGCNDLGGTTVSSEYTLKTVRFDRTGNSVMTDPVELPSQETLTRVGLKGFWKERKGSGQAFRYKLRDYFYEVKEAFRRAWVGYDACDIYDMGPILCQKLRVQLIDFYKEHSEQVDEPEIDEVVLEIIELLAFEDFEVALLDLYPGMKKINVAYRGEEFEAYDYTPEHARKAKIHQQMKLERAYTLLGRHILKLWI